MVHFSLFLINARKPGLVWVSGWAPAQRQAGQTQGLPPHVILKFDCKHKQ